MFLALVGYRGSGKSAVAQLAARQLGWDWVDADVEIELRAGKSIAAIFVEDGEAAFRDLETDVLCELIRRDRTILALGGGVLLQAENRNRLRAACNASHGKIVWLKALPETLHERIVADATTAARRPNLTAAGALPEIRELLAKREPHYRQCADWEVDTENKTAQEVAEEIVELLRTNGI